MTTGRVRAQSEPLGFALLLGITIAGALAAAVLGGAALTDTQNTAEFDQAQQALTQFDSTASQVALGSTDLQRVAMSSEGGSYTVDPNAGHMKITHYDYDGSNDHVLHQTDLGAVVYEHQGRSVAYQGGGVWASYGDGDGRIVSPPEFHYRGATLTFPIVKVTGGGGASGASTAVVQQSSPTSVLYPDQSVTSPHTYENPQTKGYIEVEIQSQFYRAWGKYFEERTDGIVSYDDPTNTVTIKLVSLGLGPGDFEMPGEGGAIELRGLGSGHTIDDFNVTFRPTDTDSADFNDLQWSLYTEDAGGQEQLEIHVRQNSGGNCDSVTADLVVYYTDDGGTTYQGWKKEHAFRGKCSDLNGDGDDEIFLVANLTNDSQSLTYQALSSNALLSTTPASASSGTLVDPVTINPHGHGAQDYGTDASDTSTKDMRFVVRHYIANFGSEVDLVVYDKNGNGGSISEDGSGGHIEYGGSGRFVTFLHVSENEIEVEFE